MKERLSLSKLHYVILRGGCKDIVPLLVEVVHDSPIDPSIRDLNVNIEFQRVGIFLAHGPLLIEIGVFCLTFQILLTFLHPLSPSEFLPLVVTDYTSTAPTFLLLKIVPQYRSGVRKTL